MIVARTRAAMRALSSRWKAGGRPIAFVPTMGALHAGHAALIERAKRGGGKVVVSIFVNPAQFGPKEDLSRYPRPFAADRRLCASLGVDALYRPTAAQVYPEGFGTFVDPPAELAGVLCGKFRPGHFRGVATVVLKLLETVRPDRAYFGEKDYQQLTVVRRMVRDLDLPVEIVAVKTVREKDGLALSSRNAYLSPAERAAAPRLFAALDAARALAESRRAGPARVEALARRLIRRIPGARLDYASLVDAATLAPAGRLTGRLRLLAAVRVGRTRLIDNVPVSC